jgi:hypothetical protein
MPPVAPPVSGVLKLLPAVDVECGLPLQELIAAPNRTLNKPIYNIRFIIILF